MRLLKSRPGAGPLSQRLFFGAGGANKKEEKREKREKRREKKEGKRERKRERKEGKEAWDGPPFDRTTAKTLTCPNLRDLKVREF